MMHLLVQPAAPDDRFSPPCLPVRVNWYRNFDRHDGLTAGLPATTITVPSQSAAGADDLVLHTELLERVRAVVLQSFANSSSTTRLACADPVGARLEQEVTVEPGAHGDLFASVLLGKWRIPFCACDLTAE